MLGWGRVFASALLGALLSGGIALPPADAGLHGCMLFRDVLGDVPRRVSSLIGVDQVCLAEAPRPPDFVLFRPGVPDCRVAPTISEKPFGNRLRRIEFNDRHVGMTVPTFVRFGYSYVP